MEELTLRPPAETDENLVWAYRQAFLDGGERAHGSCNLGECESYAFWLKQVVDRQSAKTTPPNLVPATTLMVLRKEDGELVGFLNIRHRLNGHFLNVSGHIGYSVHPSQRRKGYASEMLRLALKYCRNKLGLDRVLVTCNWNNEPSRRTILSQGGILEDECLSDGVLVQRYWIAL